MRAKWGQGPIPFFTHDGLEAQGTWRPLTRWAFSTVQHLLGLSHGGEGACGFLRCQQGVNLLRQLPVK